MRPIHVCALVGVGLAVVAAFGLAGTAFAQSGQAGVKATPFNYVLKDGRPVPKSNRISNPDGSWREEAKVGNCVTVKEGSPNGEVKITRRCD